MAREEQSDRWPRPIFLSALAPARDNPAAGLRHAFADIRRMTPTLSPIRSAKIRCPKSAHGDADCCTPSSPRDSRRSVPTGSATHFLVQKTRRTRCPPHVVVPLLPFAPWSDRDGVKNKLRDIGLLRCGQSRVPFPQPPKPGFRASTQQSHYQKQKSRYKAGSSRRQRACCRGRDNKRDQRSLG